jgi:hypothetical protein
MTAAVGRPQPTYKAYVAQMLLTMLGSLGTRVHCIEHVDVRRNRVVMIDGVRYRWVVGRPFVAAVNGAQELSHVMYEQSSLIAWSELLYEVTGMDLAMVSGPLMDVAHDRPLCVYNLSVRMRRIETSYKDFHEFTVAYLRRLRTQVKRSSASTRCM